MTDNSDRTPGTGEKVATDEATYSGDTAKIQLVRLVHVTGSEGAKTIGELIRLEDAAHTDADPGIPMFGVRNYAGPGADGEYSALSVASDGTLHVNSRNLFRIAVTSAGLTIATTNYTAGDQVGTQFSFANASRVSGGYGRIVSVMLINAHLSSTGAEVIGTYDVVFTRSSITLATDNAAYAISDADACTIVGMAQLTGAYDIGNNRIAFAHGISIPYDCSGGTTLYASLITRSAHVFFTQVGDLQLVLFVERE
jgi:hypothetical protein